MPRPASTVVTSKPARVVLGLLRLAVGFVFLWSFLDKTFRPALLDRPLSRVDQRRHARAELPDGRDDR